MTAPTMTTRSSAPGHRRSSSAGNVSASAVTASTASAPILTSSPAPESARSTITTATTTASTNSSKTPAKAKAVVKRRNSLSAGALVNKSARVLTGVIAMVDVRVGPDAQIDCSDVVAEKMAELGAVIVKRFTPRVTHIVLSQLTDVWKDKIAKWQSNISVGLARRVDGRPDVHIVSQLWVNACYVSKSRMDEKPFFPVSKAAAGTDGHLHLNGAMRQFVLNHPPPPAVSAPVSAPVPVTTLRTVTPSHSSSSSSAQRTSNTTPTASSTSTSGTASSSTSASATTTTASVRAAVASNRRRTLDSKSVSAAGSGSGTGTGSSANVSATTTATAAGAPPSRHAVIQFQFGAAAALAAATLGSHALKRKRRALSMEPMASDAIQKLLTASGNPVTPHKHENAAAPPTLTMTTTPVARASAVSATPDTTSASGTAKLLDLDTIRTPGSVEAPPKRCPMSSAKRRKTMSAVPSATLSMPVVPADPDPQKRLFHDASTDCVAESQSDDNDNNNGDSGGVERKPTDRSDAPSAATTTDDANSIVSVAAVPAAVASENAEAQVEPNLADVCVTSVATASAPVESLAAVSASTDAASINAGAPDGRVPLFDAVASDAFSIGVASTATRPVRATRAAAKRSEVAVATSTGIWTCTLCGGSNTRARRLCKDCRAPKSRAAAPSPAPAPGPSVATSSARAPRRLLVAPEPPPLPPTPVRRPVTNLSSPKATTGTAALTRRILTTPKTITKPSAGAAKRQNAAPFGSSSSAKASTSSAARKLPLAVPPRTPSRPRAAIDSTTAASALVSTATPKPARSLSVLEMTPVRVTEQVGAKRSLSTSSPSSSRATRTPAADTRVSTDQLERIVTPQRRVSSSSWRSTHSAENTPTKTPRRPAPAPAPVLTYNARPVRSVIGITGVDLETRGVIECAVHAIDASMVTEPGHRKARVVKSVDYSAAVTHLIVGDDSKRTIKVLFAIARGAWIVSESWVFASLEQEQWLPEADYELELFANRFAREHPDARQIFRSLKFFVGSNVEPSREVLQSLLQCAGGEICNQISVADMCVCGDGSLFRRAQRTGVRVVTAKWVFDSIGSMRLADDDKYGLTTDSQATTDDGDT